MKITIYAKKRKTKEGKSFYSYLTTLQRKDGSGGQTMTVKFRDGIAIPRAEECPMNIIIERGKANVAESSYVREDTGEIAYSYTLWVNEWSQGSEFVDHSLDDYEV